MIPYGKQSIDEDDIAAVVAALKSDYLTTGPQVEAFEREFADMVGAKHAVAVCNATAALHLAIRVSNIGSGDRVVTSPNTFLASANCAAFAGAIPDFCDIDPVSYNLDPATLERGWRKDTKAVVAVDYAGQPANMPEIARIARKHGAVVIEDACHGTGGSFFHEGKKWKLGGHPWADITTFSFHPVKTMTTGEGGMLVTDNDEFASRAKLLRSHGMIRNAASFKIFREKPESISQKNSTLYEYGPWAYEIHELGYNYRITDLQCALGRSQLKKIDAFIKRRLEIAEHYNGALSRLSWLTTPRISDWLSGENCSGISWHLYTVQIDFATLGMTRSRVMTDLREQGIGTQVLYIPVHLQPWYQKTYGYAAGKCPVAESYYTRSLSLPLYPEMKDEDVATVVRTVKALAS
jgi:perosamine synthetase